MFSSYFIALQTTVGQFIFKDFAYIFRTLKIFILKNICSYYTCYFHPQKLIHKIFCLKQISDNSQNLLYILENKSPYGSDFLQQNEHV